MAQWGQINEHWSEANTWRLVMEFDGPVFDLAVRWRGGSMFNVYHRDHGERPRGVEAQPWREVDVFTCYSQRADRDGVYPDEDEAQEIIRAHVARLDEYGEERDEDEDEDDGDDGPDDGDECELCDNRAAYRAEDRREQYNHLWYTVCRECALSSRFSHVLTPTESLDVVSGFAACATGCVDAVATYARPGGGDYCERCERDGDSLFDPFACADCGEDGTQVLRDPGANLLAYCDECATVRLRMPEVDRQATISRNKQD